MPHHPPLRTLRHKHYEMLRLVFGGATFAAIAKTFNCHRWTVWRLTTSPVAQEVLARWHAESHRLTVDHPIRALISYYGGRGQLRLPEGSPARQRQLRAAAQGRAALARKRAAGAVPLPDALPAPPEPSSAEAMEPLTVAPNTDQQQVAKALRTIEAMRERDAQEQRARRESRGPAPMMRPRTAVVLPHNRPAERTVRAVDPGDDSQTRLLRSCTPST
jgi:hypothetical protein